MRPGSRAAMAQVGCILLMKIWPQLSVPYIPRPPLESIVDIVAMLGVFDEAQLPAIRQELVPLIVDLVRHGIVLPSELIGA